MILRIILLLFCIALLFINCNRTNERGRTDYDQLYALWHEDTYRDSIAESLKSEISAVLAFTNTKEEREKINRLLLELRWTRDSISFFALSNKVIFFSKKVSDENILANTYNNIGMYYHDKGVLDSTFYYYVKAENIYKKLGDSLKVGEMEFFQARLLYEQGLRMESEVKVANSLRILQNFPLSAVPFEANQLMALCLIEREQYPKAKEYIEKAIGLMLEDFGKNKMLHSKFLTDAIAMGYNNLSAIEIGLGNYDQASINAEKGLKFLSEKRTKILLGLLNSNKARAGFYSNLEKHKLKSKSFISVIEETYDLAKKLGHNHLQYNSAMTIAEMYYEIENKQEALCWAQQAYLIASQNNLKVLKRCMSSN